MAWLSDNSTSGDFIWLYLATYQPLLRSRLNWNVWFPEAWRSLRGRKRILVFDVPYSEEFIGKLKYEGGPANTEIHSLLLAALRTKLKDSISLASGGYDERNPFGTFEKEEECAWTYYFCTSRSDRQTDRNSDGWLSLEELFEAASSATWTRCSFLRA